MQISKKTEQITGSEIKSLYLNYIVSEYFLCVFPNDAT